MGLRLRLKAGYSLARFHGQSLVILKALKTYGMIVADNGGSWFITGAASPKWNDDDLNQLKTVPGSAFEAVNTGPITALETATRTSSVDPDGRPERTYGVRVREPFEGAIVESIAMLQRVVDTTNGVLEHTTTEQLSNPTLCTEWTVKDLINHMVGGATMFAISAEQGSVPDDMLGQLMGGDNVGERPAGRVGRLRRSARWRRSRRRARWRRS